MGFSAAARCRWSVGGLVGGNPRCKREKRDSDNLPGLGGLLCRDGLELAVDKQAFGDGELWSKYSKWVVSSFEATGRPLLGGRDCAGYCLARPGERCRVIARAGWTWLG
jgi:hypothetical protein